MFLKADIRTELITKYIKSRGLSKVNFCKLCKVNIQTLNKILNNQKNFRIIALFRIGRVIDIPVCELFDCQ